MVRGDGCPPWCAEHVDGPGAGQHRVVLGDVRLTLCATSDLWEATYAVRRRPGRTLAQEAELTANMSAAGSLLRRQRERRHSFLENTVHDPASSQDRLAANRPTEASDLPAAAAAGSARAAYPRRT